MKVTGPCQHPTIAYGICRSTCHTCGMAWYVIANPTPPDLFDIAYIAYRAWQDYGELSEAALEDFAKQYGMQDGDWPAIRDAIQRCMDREAPGGMR
jgi:hypothetical protein